MKKWPIFCVFFLLFVFISLFASQPDVQAAVIKGTYTQKNYTAKNNRTLQSSGNFLISKEHGICWLAQKPQKTTVVMTEDAVVQITQSRKKVLGSAENPVFKEIALIIKSLFIYDADIINFYLKEEQTVDGFVYIPKEEPLKLVISNILLMKNAVGHIKNIKIRFSNDDITEYELATLVSTEILTPEERNYFEN